MRASPWGQAARVHPTSGPVPAQRPVRAAHLSGAGGHCGPTSAVGFFPTVLACDLYYRFRLLDLVSHSEGTSWQGVGDRVCCPVTRFMARTERTWPADGRVDTCLRDVGYSIRCVPLRWMVFAFVRRMVGLASFLRRSSFSLGATAGVVWLVGSAHVIRDGA